ncbi:CLUMA_CG003270, isoform A [Clunio marinus]|uniref:CLUMA_CG003270, isoform A n=1 Tax=Clunio marinus TaxID=568069 RepID=A0A1J1HNR8_9DIPT|nr:CLUMA_CG003270, isoform A [Clunio marinus]
MFPAYKDQVTSRVKSINSNFLENQSFEKITFTPTIDVDLISSSSKSSVESDIDDNVHKISHVREHQGTVSETKYFYEDFERKKEYLKLNSLPSRAVPLYKVPKYVKRFVQFNYTGKNNRYFKDKRIRKLNREKKDKLNAVSEKDEEMRIHLIKNSQEVNKWIEYIEYKDIISLSTREQTERMKLEVIEKALHFNPNNFQLMKLYIQTIPNVYSSEKVENIIEDLIARDPYNFMYWKYLLINHQSSMSCDADNALKLYEKAMKVMRKQNDSDPQMLMLFKSLCIFLRQCGLNEQFFAIIRLMISLNINESDELDKVFYTNEAQNPHLNEYEELVLKSNLPMNELWWRIETLRSICNFLPVKTVTDGQMEDPQRFVFNEDICNLINPLKNNNAHNFDLFIIILRMLKLPLPYPRNENIETFSIEDSEMECGMEFLSVLLEKLVSSTKFSNIFYNLIKDLNITPNFLNFNVEYEAYLDVILKTLVFCCNSFNERQNKIILIFWLRLQRLMIEMDKLKLISDGKEQEANDYVKYKKQIKSKVKNVLKLSKYQNDLNIILEYALIEKSLNDEKSYENILIMAMESATVSDSQSEIDFFRIAIEYCEHKLMSETNGKEDCLMQLKKIAGNDEPLPYFSSKIAEDSSIDNDDYLTDIEDYFLPKTNKLNLIKAKIYFTLVKKSKKDALEELLQVAKISSEARSWLNEKLFELYIWIFHLRLGNEDASLKAYMSVVERSLEKYPRNIFILHTVAGHATLRWFELRKLFLKASNTESIFYLLLASKYREEIFCDEDNAIIYKHRLFNTIDGLLSNKYSNISSILTWRLYLRIAFSYDFTKCKRILYQALDRHPMVKQLYLDGSRYLPEEHSQLLDLIVEKSLRAHALAEELEILRDHPIN